MAWTELEAKIVFRECTENSILASTVVDPDDLPFVTLYWTSGADAVLTNDKHISMMGAKAVLVSVTIGFGARKESFILPISTNSGRRPWMVGHTGILSSNEPATRARIV